MPQSSGQMITAWSPAATPSFVCPSMIRATASRSTRRRAAPPQDRADRGPVIAETTSFGQLMTL
jgi:hypothetical protein